MTITIYHNPDCGTSLNTLAMIRQSGAEPVVIEYLKTPPPRERLRELIAAMGISVRALLREKGTPYKELGLDDPEWTDDELLDFMLAHPILINRPIVVTPKGAQEFLIAPRDLRPGQTIKLTGVTVQVGALSLDGRPLEARVTFDVPLEDPSLKWLRWSTENMYVPFTPPAIGETVVIR